MTTRAIICDLDGTLAINDHGRDYYDATDCNKDAINIPVRIIVRWAMNAECQVIFLSGREDKYREPTIKFLEKCGIAESMYQLVMRKTDDNRKDSVIKWELYESYIEPMNYDILFILDDRDQVVEMWRDKGFTVFQVAKGDF